MGRIVLSVAHGGVGHHRHLHESKFGRCDLPIERMACCWFDLRRHLFRSWRVDNEGRVDLSIGVIDSGAKAEIRSVDPRFTTGACKALLSAMGIWIDCRNILISEVFDSEGSTSRTLTVNVSKNDINRLVRFSRSFKWHDEHMRVLFDEAEHFPEHDSRTAPHGGSTPARRHAQCFAAKVERKALRFLTPVTLTQLGMFCLPRKTRRISAMAPRLL